VVAVAYPSVVAAVVVAVHPDHRHCLDRHRQADQWAME